MLLCVNYSAITEVITSCHTLSLLDALPISTSALGNVFVYHRAVDQIIDYAIHAERDGFDAFVVGSFSEPMLREMRSAVDIPVIGILESSMLVSCSLGQSIAPIANEPEISSIVQTSVQKHGLASRVDRKSVV